MIVHGVFLKQHCASPKIKVFAMFPPNVCNEHDKIAYFSLINSVVQVHTSHELVQSSVQINKNSSR